MVWKAIRVDFTSRVKCQFCPHFITSGKGILVQHEHGQYAFSGPCCAKKSKNVINPQDKLADVTKATFEDTIQIDTESLKNKSGARDYTNSAHFNDFSEDMAKSYLVIRFEKLSHIERIANFISEKLNNIYKDFKQSGDISEQDRHYLQIVMFGDKYPEFTYKNLQAVYAADYWLSYFIKYTENSDSSFAESLLYQLRKKLTLTVKQIDGINKWFDHAEERVLKIKRNAFV